MTRAILALGANLGDRFAAVQSAVRELSAHPQVRVVQSSPVVRSAAVGGPGGQPDYLNAVVQIETTLDAGQLLRCCQNIETAHGRERIVRWGARTLDIDIITYGALVSDDKELTLPHPRARERAFVLVPWMLMEPTATLEGDSVGELAERAPDRATVTVHAT